jgi:16S rRNA processing protein RimM
VFGFRGEVRLLLHNREGGTLGAPRRVNLLLPDGSRSTVTMSARAGAGKRVIGRVEGVTTEAAAEALVGAHVWVARAELPRPPAGEFYLHDVLGLPVVDEDGAPMGTLEDVVSGERDVWVLALPDGTEGFLVATPEAVRLVDPAAGRIVVARGAVSAGE